MSSIKVFRHELKYMINEATMYHIRDKLNEVLTVDQSIDGYHVRSLYFDSINDIDYYEKINGDDNRKKIRMRIYDGDSKCIKLELKSKSDGNQFKESLLIDQKTAEQLMEGNYGVLLDYKDEVSKKIYLIMRENSYLPKNIIEYQRIAFVSNNDTRITLDYNIKSCRYEKDIFFQKEINYLDVTYPNQVILEVKFNQFLENYINYILSKYVTNKESFSKYVMGRNKE